MEDQRSEPEKGRAPPGVHRRRNEQSRARQQAGMAHRLTQDGDLAE
jgi:hypothetical protein